jgi:DNA polymerase
VSEQQQPVAGQQGQLHDLAEVVAELRSFLSWSADAGLHVLAARAPEPAAPPAAAPPLPGPAAVRSVPLSPAPWPVSPPVPRAAPPPEPKPAARPAALPGLLAKAAGPLAGTQGGKLSLPTLESVREELGDCTRCKLHKGRTNLVFGVGNPKARLVFVGEAPGEDEDLKGEPFVGKAGQLLTKMIEAMGLRREDVYICNTVKCRPPNNRNPEPDELEACEPYLKGQLASLQAEVIVTLGKFAAQALLRDQTPISRLRGGWREYQGIALMPTFHPAYLLRSPGEKGKVWGDLQLVMKKLGLPARAGGGA